MEEHQQPIDQQEPDSSKVEEDGADGDNLQPRAINFDLERNRVVADRLKCLLEGLLDNDLGHHLFAARTRASAGDAGLNVMRDDADRSGQDATVNLSEEDNTAIARMTALGYPQSLAAQAFLLSGSNEELATLALEISTAVDLIEFDFSVDQVNL